MKPETRKDAKDLCMCGHYRDEHQRDGETTLCYGLDGDLEPTCDCDEFDMDDLFTADCER